MPAPKKIAQAETFRTIRATADAHGETNDCSVIAVAVACEVSYETAHSALAAQGRRARKGTTVAQILDAVARLGSKWERVPADEFLSKYNKKIQNVTTHHPDRFKKVWKDGHTYLIVSRAHVSAVVDGELIDWARGKAKRAVYIYRITR